MRNTIREGCRVVCWVDLSSRGCLQQTISLIAKISNSGTSFASFIHCGVLEYSVIVVVCCCYGVVVDGCAHVSSPDGYPRSRLFHDLLMRCPLLCEQHIHPSCEPTLHPPIPFSVVCG